MAKKSAIEKIESELESPPVDVEQAVTPTEKGDISQIALRRQKVRELHRLGFEPKRISMILQKGIKTPSGNVIDVPCTEQTIRADLDYLAEEFMARDEGFAKKRLDVVDKYRYLYNQAMLEFQSNSDANTKNRFLNTAISILGKISDIEGLESSQKYSFEVSSESKSLRMSQEIRSLPEDDKKQIITAIKSVLNEGREQEESEGNFLLRGES